MLCTLCGVNTKVAPGAIGPESTSWWSKTTDTVSPVRFFQVTALQHADTSHCGWKPFGVICTTKPKSKFGSGLAASRSAAAGSSGVGEAPVRGGDPCACG